MVPAIYLAPQEPDGARRLFEAGMRQLGLWEPAGPITLPGPRTSATALWLAREWNLATVADTLAPAIDAEYQPTTDAARGEFTWGFALAEEHPRGQYNGTMAAAQVATEGSWWRLANVGPGTRFSDPTVVGVEFPALALDEARWDPERGVLTIGTVPIRDDAEARRTSFRVVNLDDPSAWEVVDEREQPAEFAAIERGLEVVTTMARHRLQVRRASTARRALRTG
jgi:hypothetical protein